MVARVLLGWLLVTRVYYIFAVLSGCKGVVSGCSGVAMLF